MKYALAIVTLATLLLFAISFVDSSIKHKDILLVSFGMFLGVIAKLITTYIETKNEEKNLD